MTSCYFLSRAEFLPVAAAMPAFPACQIVAKPAFGSFLNIRLDTLSIQNFYISNFLSQAWN